MCNTKKPPPFQGCGSVFIFPDPDPDPEFEAGDQYGSGCGSNPGFNDQKLKKKLITAENFFIFFF
jgi:hypothetical protein